MHTLSDTFYRISSSRVALLALVGFLLFTMLVLPAQNRKAAAMSGERSPDLSLFYTSADLLSMAESYGPEGRAAYVQARIRFDILWPLVYGLFLCISFSWLGQRLFQAGSRWRWLNLLPILAVILDYLENISAASAIGYYPQSPAWALVTAPIFTPLKWLLVGGSFLLLLPGLLAWMIRRKSIA